MLNAKICAAKRWSDDDNIDDERPFCVEYNTDDESVSACIRVWNEWGYVVTHFIPVNNAFISNRLIWDEYFHLYDAIVFHEYEDIVFNDDSCCDISSVDNEEWICGGHECRTGAIWDKNDRLLLVCVKRVYTRAPPVSLASVANK